MLFECNVAQVGIRLGANFNNRVFYWLTHEVPVDLCSNVPDLCSNYDKRWPVRSIFMKTDCRAVSVHLVTINQYVFNGFLVKWFVTVIEKSVCQRIFSLFIITVKYAN